MKRVGIVTLYGNANYGNKLQNYAVQETLKKFGLDPITIRNIPELNNKRFFIVKYIKFALKYFLHRFIIKDDKYTDNEFNKDLDRTNNFICFDKYIKTTNKTFNYLTVNKFNNYDYYCVGSDQIWNPNYGCLNHFDLLGFVNSNNKFSLSASLGVSMIDDKKKALISKYLPKFKGISVREEKGKEVLSSIIDKDVKVILDPTMLLTDTQWTKVMKKPVYKNNNKKYILLYFLGQITDEYNNYILNISKEYNLDIINILDTKSNYYKCGPSEFLWLEKNAELIFTDSFHSCVFSILFKKPFLVFDRKDNLKSMNSRIDTLLTRFKLEDRRYGVINNDIFKCNYDECNDILNEERKKAYDFLKGVIE